MTDKKRLKERVRARMAKTGEGYTTARRHVAGGGESGNDGSWRFLGGVHPSSAVISSILANALGVQVSEPLVFLAGGGIGAGYILWEWKHDGSRTLVLGFHNQWQYYDRWMSKTLDRLNVTYDRHETGGARLAAARLAEELAQGPCVVLPDRYQIGYWHLPPYLDGHGGHPVIAYRLDGDMVRVDDRGQVPILVPKQRMDAARARVSSYRNILYAPRWAAPDVERAVREGLRDCAEHLSARSDSFSLPAWRKWSRMMTDTRNAKGWPRVFAGGDGVEGALLSLWEGVQPVGMDGGNLRDLFADGLDEAAALLGEPELRPLAGEFRRVHGLWHGLAEAAPPGERLRELTAAVRESLLSEGTADADDARELWKLRAVADKDPRTVDFADLGARLEAIYLAESAAIARLREIV